MGYATRTGRSGGHCSLRPFVFATTQHWSVLARIWLFMTLTLQNLPLSGETTKLTVICPPSVRSRLRVTKPQ